MKNKITERLSLLINLAEIRAQEIGSKMLGNNSTNWAMRLCEFLRESRQRMLGPAFFEHLPVPSLGTRHWFSSGSKVVICSLMEWDSSGHAMKILCVSAILSMWQKTVFLGISFPFASPSHSHTLPCLFPFFHNFGCGWCGAERKTGQILFSGDLFPHPLDSVFSIADSVPWGGLHNH